jgi:hypothetical protein
MYNKIFSGYQPDQMVEWPSSSSGYCKYFQYLEDEDGDGPQNVGFFAIQPSDAAGSPRRFYYV